MKTERVEFEDVMCKNRGVDCDSFHNCVECLRAWEKNEDLKQALREQHIHRGSCNCTEVEDAQ